MKLRNDKTFLKWMAAMVVINQLAVWIGNDRPVVNGGLFTFIWASAFSWLLIKPTMNNWNRVGLSFAIGLGILLTNILLNVVIYDDAYLKKYGESIALLTIPIVITLLVAGKLRGVSTGPIVKTLVIFGAITAVVSFFQPVLCKPIETYANYRGSAQELADLRNGIAVSFSEQTLLGKIVSRAFWIPLFLAVWGTALKYAWVIRQGANSNQSTQDKKCETENKQAA